MLEPFIAGETDRDATGCGHHALCGPAETIPRKRTTATTTARGGKRTEQWIVLDQLVVIYAVDRPIVYTYVIERFFKF